MPEVGDALRMAGVNSTPLPEGRALPNSDDAFEKLLLRITGKAAERGGASSLIQFFCHATREFFQASGVYFWRRHAGDELVGEQADGKLAERFIGIRHAIPGQREHSRGRAQAPHDHRQ